MADVYWLPVHFHFNGEFFRNSNELFYVGGTEAISYIDRDRLSLSEVLGHLRDHCDVKEGTLLHWLFPGREMSIGLRALVDDKACQYMSDCVVDGVAEVYVEKHELGPGCEQDRTDEGNDYEEDIEDNSEEEDLEALDVRKSGSEDQLAIVVLSKTQQSSTSFTKRNSTADVSSTHSRKKVCV
jgi:alpha-galactosidase